MWTCCLILISCFFFSLGSWVSRLPLLRNKHLRYRNWWSCWKMLTRRPRPKLNASKFDIRNHVVQIETLEWGPTPTQAYKSEFLCTSIVNYLSNIFYFIRTTDFLREIIHEFLKYWVFSFYSKPKKQNVRKNIGRILLYILQKISISRKTTTMKGSQGWCLVDNFFFRAIKFMPISKEFFC